MLNAASKTFRIALLTGLTAIGIATAPISESLTMSRAAAQNQSGHTIPFDQAYTDAVQRMLYGLDDGACYSQGQSRRIELAFFGILPQTVAFSDTLRQTINQKARDATRKILGIGGRIIDPSAFGTIARMTGLNTLDRQQLIGAVQRATNAPLSIVISATRPSVNVGQLRIEFFARNDSGVAVCPTVETLFVNLEPLHAITDTSKLDFVGGEFVAAQHAYRYVFQRTQDLLQSFKHLEVEVESNLTGPCRLQTTADSAFRSAYTEVSRGENASLNPRGQNWPTLIARDAKPPEGDSVGKLRLTLTSHPGEKNVLDAEIEIRRGQEQLALRLFRMVVSPSEMRGCSTLRTDPLTRLELEAAARPSALTMIPKHQPFRVNRDAIELEFRLAADRHLYCWIVDKSHEAYLLYPLSAQQQTAPWSANRTVQYPTDLGLGRVHYPQATSELLGCFTHSERIPRDVEQKWLEASPSARTGASKPPFLLADEFRELRAAMRAVPGIEETYARVNVVD